MNSVNKDCYHYSDSGLDWVVLANGFTVHKTPYGEGVSIQDLNGLHACIARIIISGPVRIRGQELKFLRSMLDLSQSGLGKVIGLSRPTIARLEGKPDTPIPEPADRALRLFYALKEEKPELAVRICELLAEIDEADHKKAFLRKQGGAWNYKMAA
jgi:DNA-binding XRE family transcriptional regulator